MEKFSHEKLVDWLIDYYTFEFKDLEMSDKINKINYVIQNNAKIFLRNIFHILIVLNVDGAVLK